MNTLSNVRIGVKVNGKDAEKDWVASCSLPDLVDAILNESEVQGRAISPQARIMSIMD